MSAEGRPLDMLVDAASVVGEVREDCEGGLDGPVLHQLHLWTRCDQMLQLVTSCYQVCLSPAVTRCDHYLDLFDAGGHGVARVAEGLVLPVVLGVARLASLVAPGRAAALLAGSPGAVHVVLARLDLVGLAADVRSIEASGDEALLVPELPGRAGEAAVAAEAAGEAAGEQVLGAHLLIDVLSSKGGIMNQNSIIMVKVLHTKF